MYFFISFNSFAWVLPAGEFAFEKVADNVYVMQYMPIIAMVRHNNEMQTFYERLVSRGKPKMLAQIAVMRKVILLAHSLYKNDQEYDPNRYLDFIQEKAKVA